MRFRRSSPDEHEALTATEANFALQMVDKQVPLKAEKLLGLQTGDFQHRRLSNEMSEADDCVCNDEFEATAALARMREAFTTTCPWTPWSPDDLYPYGSQPYHPHQAGIESTPDGDGSFQHQSLANVPAGCDFPQQSYHVTGDHDSAITTNDYAQRSAKSSILASLAQPLPTRRRLSSRDMKQHEVSRRSKTTGHSLRPRKLDLVQLFPQPRPSDSRLQSSSQLPSPHAALDPADMAPGEEASTYPYKSRRGGRPGVPKRSSTNPLGQGSTKREPEEDVFDQHKTNVRRPPKGIQNWFDAYLDSDDDNDDDNSEKYDEGYGTAVNMEPQELPGDDILPPAYTPSSSDAVRVSEKGVFPAAASPPLFHNERACDNEEPRGCRNESEYHSWDSIQSSHIGRIEPDGIGSRIGSDNIASQSVCSASETDYEDDDAGSDRLPAIRDSIIDDRNVTIGSASSIDLQKIQKGERLVSMHGTLSDSKTSKKTSWSSDATPVTQRLGQVLHATSGDEMQQTTGRESRHTSWYGSEGNAPPPFDAAYNPANAAHMMVVTEEEKMLLDHMRRKRAAMQQTSFTEGYQLALQTEQQRLARRAASAEPNTLKALKKKKGGAHRDSQMCSVASPTMSSDEADMRRQLSIIQKEEVDEDFHIERFLGMQQPQPLSSHPPSMPDNETASSMPPSTQTVGELLPSTVYAPNRSCPNLLQPSINPTEARETDAVKKRVQQFIVTNGAVPPLNTMPRQTRRNLHRTPGSMPPSPVIEEDVPDVPMRHPARAIPSRHMAVSRHSVVHKASCLSMDDEPRDKTPISSLASWESFNEQIRAEHGHSIGSFQKSPSEASPDHTSATPSPLIATKTSASSPFSSIISAATSASAASPRRHAISNASPQSQAQNASWRSATSPSMSLKDFKRSLPPTSGLPPLVTHPLAPRRSVLNPAHASEDVLAAWAELGGGTDALANVPTMGDAMNGRPVSRAMNVL